MAGYRQPALSCERPAETYTPTADGRTTVSSIFPLLQSIRLHLREKRAMSSLWLPVFTQTAEKLKAASAVEIQNHKENKIDSDRTLSIKDAAEASNTTTVRYADVFSSVDVEYLLSGNDIKENIIVNDAQNEYNRLLCLGCRKSDTGIKANRRDCIIRHPSDGYGRISGFLALICMMLMAKYPMMYPTSCQEQRALISSVLLLRKSG